MSHNIHQGHRERMRTRSLQEGTHGFADHEILEMILFYAKPRVDTNPLSHALLERFGSLKDVLDASVEQLMSVEGVGPGTAHLIKLHAESVRRYFEASNPKTYQYDNIGKITSFLYSKFLGIDYEVAYMMLFNSRLNLLALVKISEGVINCSDIMTRKVAESIIRHNAAVVLFAHNHPQGLAFPSGSDRTVTEELRTFVENMGVYFLDHLIFADRRYASIMKDSYGFNRIAPVTQRYDPAYFEAFYDVPDDDFCIPSPFDNEK